MITSRKKGLRETTQFLITTEKPGSPEGKYDIYPAYPMVNDLIFTGFYSLAEVLAVHKTVIIDGYIGVFYDYFRECLSELLEKKGKKVTWNDTAGFMKSPGEIEEMIAPFMGGNDPLFGKRTDLLLTDFFDMPLLHDLEPDSSSDINIMIGPGASLSGWNGLTVYLDIPKNEIQFRSRAGSIANLGAASAIDPREMYKRFYFVDWIVLNRHKQEISGKIDIIADAQRPGVPVWMHAASLREALADISRNCFRVRPWFEPGAWGGTWIRDHIQGLNREVPNYAWSFELIVPENGLLFESSGLMLEVSFDFLMFQEAEAVLGDCHKRFGSEFPIRFDFLDTFDGGNLSVQCHPRPGYTMENFGEDFTQEETYYILDTKDNAGVYLGFREDIDPDEFRNALDESQKNSVPVDMEKFVQLHPASKHDLFLIPYGTVHGSGINNLVLEISSTPYIFTFKMYDWVRPDLNGQPRTLNIARAMENLYFDRKGNYVKDKLLSRPVLIGTGDGWELYHLPTHETHLYDVHRIHLKSSVEIKTENKCHVLSLVEGTSIRVETENGSVRVFSYAETFVIPAAAKSYRITNRSGDMAYIVKAFVK